MALIIYYFPAKNSNQICLFFRIISREVDLSQNGQEVRKFILSQAQKLYTNLLFDKQIMFSASLIRQISRTSQEISVIIDSEFVDQLKTFSEEPILPLISQIFRTFSAQAQNQIKKKPYYTLADNDPDKDIIKERQQQLEAAYDFYNQEKPLFDQLSSVSCEEILEKYCILGYLVADDARRYLTCGQNPFSVTIFKEKFKNLSPRQIMALYGGLNQKYSLEVNKLQNLAIINLKYKTTSTRQMENTFNQELERHKRLKNEFKFGIQVGALTEFKQNTIINSLIISDIVKQLTEMTNSGINCQTEIEAVRQYLHGNMDENIIRTFYSLLLVSNHRLGGILKLPHHFKLFMPYLTELVKRKHYEHMEKMLEAVDNKSPLPLWVNRFQLDQSTHIEFADMQHIKKEKIKVEDLLSNKINKSEFESIILGSNPSDFPIDLEGKSPEELIELGFEPVDTVEYRVDKDGSVASDLETDPKKKQEIEELLKEFATPDIKK